MRLYNQTVCRASIENEVFRPRDKIMDAVVMRMIPQFDVDILYFSVHINFSRENNTQNLFSRVHRVLIINNS